MLASELLKAVSAAAKASEARPTLPIYASLLLEQRDGKLTITGTRGSETRVVRIDSDLPTMRVAVNAKLLQQQLSGLSGVLKITDLGSKLRLQAEKRTFEIATESADVFPQTPEVQGKNSITFVDAAILADLLDRTSYAASDDFTRPMINGVQLELEPGKVRAIATDGHRMAVCVRDVKHDMTAKVLVPLGGARLFAELAAHGKAVVFSWDEATARLTGGADTVICRLTEAVFPPWNQVLPKGETTHSIPRAEWLESVRAVGAVAGASKSPRLDMRFGDDILHVAAAHDASSGADEVTCSSMPGAKHLAIAVAPRYLVDALSSLAGADNIDVCCGGELDPMTLRTPDTIAVVMPMRI